MSWLKGLGQRAWRGRLSLRIDRRRAPSAGSSAAGSTERLHATLCSRCLYRPGSIPATTAIVVIDNLNPNSFSCASCGRPLDR